MMARDATAPGRSVGPDNRRPMRSRLALSHEDQPLVLPKIRS